MFLAACSNSTVATIAKLEGKPGVSCAPLHIIVSDQLNIYTQTQCRSRPSAYTTKHFEER